MMLTENGCYKCGKETEAPDQNLCRKCLRTVEDIETALAGEEDCEAFDG